MQLSSCQFVLTFLVALAGRQQPADVHVDEEARNSIVDTLVSKIQVGYVVPEAARAAITMLRNAEASGTYDGLGP